MDARIIAVELDGASILRRNDVVEQERRVAIHDLIEDNSFRLCAKLPNGYNGPYRLTLGLSEDRLILTVADEAGVELDCIGLGLARFKRLVRDYFLVCDSYFRAVRRSTAAEIETLDMARRSLHDEGAELLCECLDGKVAVDAPTARRLFTLMCVLHARA